MAHPLSEKVVIITGASSGIGEASARALAACGSKLVLSARRRERLEELAAELEVPTLVAPADLSVVSEAKRLIEETLEHFGRIDVLFANAGIYIPGEASEGDPEAWEQLMAVNVNGVLSTARAALPHLIEQGSGDILVTSSISGHVDIPWEPVYSASKHAVQSFVHTLRRQVAPHGVRVGSIAPGMVANELWGFTDRAAIDEKVAAHEAIRSEDVAQLVVVMLSQPPHVTIRNLVVLPQKQDI
ncbi:MAG: SDR family oxidoreductase [Trueperaceae bacterium]|nr:MAG: SDR family oxidoreductase [Trueperaceae bacterium]